MNHPTRALLACALLLAACVRAKGYPVAYREFEAGHNWTAWRDNLAEAFVALREN